jgi:hypothetical protein
MSDEQDSDLKFRMSVPASKLPGATAEALLHIRASVDALATTLFYALGENQEDGLRLVKIYNHNKKEFLLEYAFELQDTPPDEGGTTE